MRPDSVADAHPQEDALLDTALGSEDPEVRRHLARCAACSQRVADFADVSALVRAGSPQLVAPPPGVWDAVSAAIEAPEPELDRRRSARHHRSRLARVPAWWVAGAAAAGVVLGAVGGGLLGGTGEDEPTTTVLARTSLDTLDTGTTTGSADAVRVGSGLDLDVSTSGLEPADGYLEVWLINRDGERMVSLGVLRPGASTQRFTLDERLVDQGYVVVDISREGFDDRPEHSGDSLARGTLEL